MAQTVIDLSGKGGLAQGFHGDLHSLNPTPQLLYDVKEGQLASGVFNPYLRKGYLAPSTDTTTTFTIDTPSDTQFGSYEYDVDSDDIILCDRVNNVYKLDSTTDTSVAFLDDFQSASFAGRSWDALYDAQIYELNGERRVYFIGKGLTMGSGPLTSLGSTSVAEGYITAGLSIHPAASTKPAIQANARNFTAASATTTTQSLTIPSGSDQLLVVVAMWPSNASASSCTWNGTAMTSIGSSTTGPSSRIWVLPAPAQGTFNVVVTWGSSVVDRLVYAFVVNNAKQASSQLDEDFTRQQTTLLVTTEVNYSIPYTSVNALNIVAAYIRNNSISDLYGVASEIYNTTNTWGGTGSDYLLDMESNGYGLQASPAPLPLSSLGNSNWLTGEATGAFVQSINTDYAFMRVADNGFAYIFADNAIHKVDGTTTGGVNGTVTKNVLLFPSYFRIVDAVDYRSRLYVALHQYPTTVSTTNKTNFPGKCGLFVWNRISTQLTSTDYIELPGVKEIKKIYASPDGVLKLLVVSDNGLTELRQFGYNDSGGVVFPVTATLSIGGHPQFPDGLTVSGDKALWLGNDGNLYCEKENRITILHQAKVPGQTTATVANNISTGVVVYGSGLETASSGFREYKQGYVLSYLDGATHVIEKVYPFDFTTGSNGSQTPNVGNVYSAVQYIPLGSAVRNVRIYNAPISTTGSNVIATVKLYFDQKTTATRPSGMTKTITRDEAKRGYVDFKINEPYIHAIQVEIEWATGESIGDNTYMPSVAIITYDETTHQTPDNG